MANRRIADEALTCFVLWCRQNPAHIVTNPEVARKVLASYTKARPPATTEEPGDG